MSGHTPAPWYALKKSVLLDRPGLEMLTPVARCISSREIPLLQAVANARLIAAAPEMLEALKAAKEAGTYVIQLCEANDKAGTSPNPNEKSDWVGTVAHCYAAMSFLSKVHAAIAKAEEV